MMRTLLGTDAPQTHPETLFPFHRATTPSQRRAVLAAYHEDMRSRGLSPYNCLLPFEYDFGPSGWAGLMDRFWNGKAFVLPADVQAELERWRGHSIMLQHIGAAHHRRTPFVIAGVKTDDLDFEIEAGPFYVAAEKVFRAAGVTPYVLFDEPPAGNAMIAARVLRITEAVRLAGDIRVGPACVATAIPEWVRLGARFNWWVIKNLGVTGVADYRSITGNAELWTYFTSAYFLRPGNEAQIGPMFASARAYGATGVLLWTVFPFPERPQDSCALYALPEAGEGLTLEVKALPKMAAFCAALKTTADGGPQTTEERLADLERRVSLLEVGSA